MIIDLIKKVPQRDKEDVGAMPVCSTKKDSSHIFDRACFVAKVARFIIPKIVIVTESCSSMFGS
jgi:hypothetical protein